MPQTLNYIHLMKLFLSALLSLFAVNPVMSQESDFSVFTGEGKPSSLGSIVSAMEGVNVVFLGELHDDSVGHRIQLELFSDAVSRYGPKRSVVLSLEMFERDVQTSVDEYLAGLIPENQFLGSSRPWGNYKTDYRPLVELAKENKLEVVAANAPRRYVNMVSRLGRDSLNKLSDQAKFWIAPLPYDQASQAYADKFNKLMGEMSDGAAPAAHNPIINSQALWDATMAHSISNVLWRDENALVINLNGGFHSENRMGTPEHLAKYKPGVKFLVVTIRYESDFRIFDPASHSSIGDFVVLTDSAAPRSKR